jgi:hypothetical protein
LKAAGVTQRHGGTERFLRASAFSSGEDSVSGEWTTDFITAAAAAPGRTARRRGHLDRAALVGCPAHRLAQPPPAVVRAP